MRVPSAATRTFFFFGYESLRDRERSHRARVGSGARLGQQWRSEFTAPDDPAAQEPFVSAKPNILNNNLASLPQWTAQCGGYRASPRRLLSRAFTHKQHGEQALYPSTTTTSMRTGQSDQYALQNRSDLHPRTRCTRINFYQDTSLEPSIRYPGSRVLPGFGCRSEPLSVSGLSETHVFSPSLLNTARFGFNRYEQSRLQQDGSINFVGQYGLQNVFSQFLSSNLGVPATSVTSFATVGGPNNIPQDFVNNTYNWARTVILYQSRPHNQVRLRCSPYPAERPLHQQWPRPVHLHRLVECADYRLLHSPTFCLATRHRLQQPVRPKIYIRASFAGYVQDDWKVVSCPQPWAQVGAADSIHLDQQPTVELQHCHWGLIVAAVWRSPEHHSIRLQEDHASRRLLLFRRYEDRPAWWLRHLCRPASNVLSHR